MWADETCFIFIRMTFAVEATLILMTDSWTCSRLVEAVYGRFLDKMAASFCSAEVSKEGRRLFYFMDDLKVFFLGGRLNFSPRRCLCGLISQSAAFFPTVEGSSNMNIITQVPQSVWPDTFRARGPSRVPDLAVITVSPRTESLMSSRMRRSVVSASWWSGDIQGRNSFRGRLETQRLVNMVQSNKITTRRSCCEP